MQIDRITPVYVDGQIKRTSSRVNVNVPIPGGMNQYFSKGTEVPVITFGGFFNGTNAVTLAQQLTEIYQNPDWPPSYFQFDPMENSHDGWYVIDKFDTTREQWMDTFVDFGIQAKKVGTAVRMGTWYDQWSSAAEAYSGWSSLTTTKMVSLPKGAASVADTVYATMTGSEGTNQIVNSPAKTTTFYVPSATVADWYNMECKVYDSVTAGGAEASWVQVFGKNHKFTGDIIVQNGLLRYQFSTTGTFYVYDSITTNAWVSIGTLKTALTGNLDATIQELEFTKINPEEIRWQEIRQNGKNPILLKYRLRRGAYFCRVNLATTSLAIGTGTFVRLGV